MSFGGVFSNLVISSYSTAGLSAVASAEGAPASAAWAAGLSSAAASPATTASDAASALAGACGTSCCVGGGVFATPPDVEAFMLDLLEASFFADVDCEVLEAPLVRALDSLFEAASGFVDALVTALMKALLPVFMDVVGATAGDASFSGGVSLARALGSSFVVGVGCMFSASAGAASAASGGSSAEFLLLSSMAASSGASASSPAVFEAPP
mmetsp:Transcript_8279/g.20880  ORF Transcript_8279/g.20880 Transcript_8279/m.20880 type:complete len:211 (-) Transcript_8279:71-703(-)